MSNGDDPKPVITRPTYAPIRREPAKGFFEVGQGGLEARANNLFPVDVGSFNLFPNYKEIIIDRPTILSLRHSDNDSFYASGTPALYITLHVSPLKPVPFTAGSGRSRGMQGGRGWIYIPTPGKWHVGVECDKVGSVLLERIDAADSWVVEAYLQDFQGGPTQGTNGGIYATEAVLPLVATVDAIALGLAECLHATSVTVQNVGVNPVQLSWGDGPYGAGTGYRLVAGGETRFEPPRLPTAALWAVSTLGSSVIVSVVNRPN